MSSKDKSTMLKSLSEEKHRTIVQNLEFLDEKLVDKGSSKFKRRYADMSNDDFVKYQRDRSQSDFEILRSKPKICTLIEKIHNNEMNEQLYPFVTPPRHAKKEKSKEKKPAKGAETFS